MAFQDRLQISRQKLELTYSIIILVLIPLLVIVLTLILTSDVKSNYDRILGRKADLANQIAGLSLKDQLDDKQQLASTIDKIGEIEEVERASIIVVDDGKYIVEASTDESAVGLDLTQDPLVISVANAVKNDTPRQSYEVKQPSDINNSVEALNILTPIKDDQGDITAMMNMKLSFAVVESHISDMLQKSIFIMIAIVTVILILLLNHFKFVEYALLFRKLKEVDQMKSDFLSVATHELKSPMAVIKGYIENILDGVVGQVDDKAKKSLQAVHGEVERMVGLVTDLLNVSHIEQGKITYIKEHVIVSDAITEVVKRYQNKAQDKGLELVYKSPENHLIIDVDRGRFIEIMTNLIDNAIKYSLKGSVVVSHEVDGKTLKTKIKDTGIGMSAKERQYLFNRFYRIKNDKTQSISGTGLGLWIIKQYIEAMDGHIYVESLEGVGSEFIVEFPIVQEKAPPPDLQPNGVTNDLSNTRADTSTDK